MRKWNALKETETKETEIKDTEWKETGRIEAFSDGVFAVAITLLVLDLHVPALDKLPAGGLAHALFALWPTVGAYGVSFVTILIMWLNHHRLFEQIQRKDHALQLLNGLLLILVTLIPFPTSLVAEYVRTPYAQVALAVYCGLNFLMACAFNLLWSHASRGGRLLGDKYDQHRVQHITAQYRLGPLLYAVTVGLAFINVIICCVAVAALAIFFALPEHLLTQPATK